MSNEAPQLQTTNEAATHLEAIAADSLENFGESTKQLPASELGDQPFEASHESEHIRRVGGGVLEVTTGHGRIIPGEDEGYAVVARGDAPKIGFGKKYDEDSFSTDTSAQVSVSKIKHDAASLSSNVGKSQSPEGSQVTSFIETKPSLTHGGDIKRTVSVQYNESGRSMINTNQTTTDSEGKVVRERDWMSYPDGGGSENDVRGKRSGQVARDTAQVVAERVGAKVASEKPLVSDNEKQIQEAAAEISGQAVVEREKVSLL